VSPGHAWPGYPHQAGSKPAGHVQQPVRASSGSPAASAAGSKAAGQQTTPLPVLRSVCHLLSRHAAYFFCSISTPQHFSVPVPPLVTMTCELHFVQMYILPSWFAISVSVPFYSRMAPRAARLLLEAQHAAPLPTFEDRLALLPEGIDAFPPILCRLQ
jgi:hypothetical protein